MSVVYEKESGEFVNDKNFRGQASRQHPLPLGHDGLVRTEDAHHGIFARRQFFVEAPARGGAGVVLDAIHAAAETEGRVLVAGDQIEFHGIAIDIVELRDQAIEHGARPALDQEHARKRRYGAAEDVAQDISLRVPVPFSLPSSLLLILTGPLKPALTRETSIRKPGDLGETTYRAGRSSSAPLLPHRCYALRKSLEFRSRGP